MSRNEHELWLSKADDDLEWCRASLREKIYYGSCFVAQQAAEKALKAYLLFKAAN
ncbi:HEPN domain-containing protein [Candidatus Gottesmanbacteria bacterium]|nr:HEPN domain-containing protein [Candidatus Gottesmanbacteria bacterium]